MAKCEHDVGCTYDDYGDTLLQTEEQIWEIIKETLEFNYGNGTLNFKKRNYFDDIEELSEMDFFAYCPWCGCDISEKNIKSRLQKKVGEYVKELDKGKFTEILAEREAKRIEEEKEHEKSRIKSNAGYVYIMQMGDYYKIGISTNPKKRAKEFTHLPEPIELIHTEKVCEYVSVEQQLHDIYSAKNKRGEWFSLTEQDIEDIKKYLYERKYTE